MKRQKPASVHHASVNSCANYGFSTVKTRLKFITFR